MRKTIKKTYQEENDDDDSVENFDTKNGFETSTKNGFETATNGIHSNASDTIEKSQLSNESRSNRVHELLNKMDSVNVENGGSKLADFKPPPSPELTGLRRGSDIRGSDIRGSDSFTRGSDSFTPDIMSPDELLPENAMMPPVPSFFQQAPKNRMPVKSISSYGANDLGLTQFSNYNTTYDSSRLVQKPYYAKMGIGSAGGDDKLMEKLNYMIHLLEQQQHEKTDNVMEEFILYTFLGVFVIFMSDSFARAGKYVR